uniref:Farnesyl pyrophosphate synthase n=1 Tax=Romanomermis culicivorax TaxID=13658 RepID=A0A915HS68_ROMCU
MNTLAARKSIYATAIFPKNRSLFNNLASTLILNPKFQMTNSNFMTKTDFLSHYPAIKNSIISFFTSKCKLYCPKVPLLWLEKLLDYNVPNGKLNRGLTLVHAYQCLNDNISQENLHEICKLGWTIELLESCFLIADDVMDSSITRRGRPCWYKNEEIGLTAINDAFLLENAADLIINEILNGDKRYLAIMNIYREAKLVTMLGQHMDSQKFDINLCTKERYFDITRCKTSYYTFILPVLAAVRMSSSEIEIDHGEEQLRKLCIKMGHYFQCQDDYLDCYGNADVTGKIGTDIEDGKCTWLLVEALDMIKAKQRKIIEENYAKSDPSNVKMIKNLYDFLNLRSKYEQFESEQVGTLTEMIENLNLVKLRPLFTHLLSLLRGRKK